MPAIRTLILAPILAVSAMLLLTACPDDQSAGEPRNFPPDSEFALIGADKAVRPNADVGDVPPALEDMSALNDFSPLPAPVSVAQELFGEPARPIELAQNAAPVRAPVTVLRTLSEPNVGDDLPMATPPSRVTTITLQSIPAQVTPPALQPEAPPVAAAEPAIPPAAIDEPIAEPVITAVPAARPAMEAEDAIPAVTAAAAPEPAPAIEPVAQDTPGRSLADIAATNSGWRVQISALSSQEAAESMWTRLQGQHATLLGEQTLYVERADLSKGIFYRVQTGPLGERAAAAQLCDQLQAEGQDCFITGGPVEAGAANDIPKAAAR